MFLEAAELALRVREIGAEIAQDYDGLEPMLVGSLKASIPFICDLSRALPILHALDFVELAGYGRDGAGAHEGIRFLKDLNEEIDGRHVVLVDEVIDTGLTMNYLVGSLVLRNIELPVRAARAPVDVEDRVDAAASGRPSRSAAPAVMSRRLAARRRG